LRRFELRERDGGADLFFLRVREEELGDGGRRLAVERFLAFSDPAVRRLEALPLPEDEVERRESGLGRF
jgi:hypothetical protein